MVTVKIAQWVWNEDLDEVAVTAARQAQLFDHAQEAGLKATIITDTHNEEIRVEVVGTATDIVELTQDVERESVTSLHLGKACAARVEATWEAEVLQAAGWDDIEYPD